jgi:hypothetical protein
MNSIASSATPPSNKTLMRLAAIWLALAIVGQWLFSYFIGAFYGVATLAGNFPQWAKNPILIKGYVAGDTTGNLNFAAHILLAAVIAMGGALQLIPWLRANAPRFHRWNGRVFMVSVILASVGGLYLTWVRGTYKHWVGAAGISLDAVLIVGFAFMAWRTARARDFVAHRRWALRTFIVASGVWFMRAGYFAWFIVMQGPVGVKKGMDGAFDFFWAFGCYLVPLAVLELYMKAKDSDNPKLKLASAIVLGVFTLLMTIGIAGAAFLLWRPLIARVN